jgi:hypothetical protein
MSTMPEPTHESDQRSQEMTGKWEIWLKREREKVEELEKRLQQEREREKHLQELKEKVKRELEIAEMQAEMQAEQEMPEWVKREQEQAIVSSVPNYVISSLILFHCSIHRVSFSFVIVYGSVIHVIMFAPFHRRAPTIMPTEKISLWLRERIAALGVGESLLRGRGVRGGLGL